VQGAARPIADERNPYNATFVHMKNHLSTLSVLHYVSGGLTCFGGFFLLLIALLGHFLGSDWLASQGEDAPPAFVGGLFIVLGWSLFFFTEAIGILNLVSGGLIAARKGRTFSMAISAIDCLNFPLGTALGVYSLVVLSNEDVLAEYEAKAPNVSV
jgi:hypothetical protein